MPPDTDPTPAVKTLDPGMSVLRRLGVILRATKPTSQAVAPERGEPAEVINTSSTAANQYRESLLTVTAAVLPQGGLGDSSGAALPTARDGAHRPACRNAHSTAPASPPSSGALAVNSQERVSRRSPAWPSAHTRRRPPPSVSTYLAPPS